MFLLGQQEHRSSLFRFVHRIHTALQDGHKVKIDFAQTKRLYPCGTLFFIANLDTLLTAHSGKINCNYPRDDVVEQLFQHLGYLERMGLSARKTVTADNVKDWHLIEGTRVDASEFPNLIKEYQASFETAVHMALYASLTEAVTNTVQHAYPDHQPGTDPMKKWWMFAQRKDDELTIAICDLGIGIAGSLKRKPVWRDYTHFGGKKSLDRKLIEAAIGVRTSTRLPHRGKGLPEMLDFVRTSNIGGMIIHSNHGGYSYDAKTRVERGRRMDPPMPGTLIQWTLSIAEQQDT